MKSESTVFVVDDDPAIVNVISELVTLIGLKAVSFGSAEEFLAAYKPAGPACMVLDVRMPGMSGMELQRRLAAAGTTIPTIMLTGHADVRMAVEAMKLGALEFLEKPCRMQELCDSIQEAIKVDEDRWHRRELQQKTDRRLEKLTPAEREVVDLILAGMTNKTIAEELGLSVRAIEDRRSRMMKKLRVKSRRELVALVQQQNLAQGALVLRAAPETRSPPVADAVVSAAREA